MADSIREQILDGFLTRAADIRTANGFQTEIGQSVLEATKLEDPDDIPLINLWPRPEESDLVEGRHVNTMTVRLEAVLAHGADALGQGEAALADMIEAFAGVRWTMPFNSGGTYEVAVGDTVAGATSGATGYVTDVDVSSGTWAGGDAAGDLTLRRVYPPVDFEDGENLNVGANSNVATINGDVTYETPETVATAGLAKSITYRAGGVESYPDAGHTVVGVFAEFEVEYVTRLGDPYAQ